MSRLNTYSRTPIARADPTATGGRNQYLAIADIDLAFWIWSISPAQPLRLAAARKQTAAIKNPKRLQAELGLRPPRQPDRHAEQIALEK